MESLMRLFQKGLKSRKTDYILADGLEEADLRNYLLRKFPNKQQDVEVTLVGLGHASSETRTMNRLDTDVFCKVQESYQSKFCCRLPRKLEKEEHDEIELLRSGNAPSTDEVTEESGDERNKEAVGYGRDHRSNRSSGLVGRDEKTRRDQRQWRQSERAVDAKIRSDYMDGLN
ncbi:hypothetical protein CPLU01_01394 [Colletotrichum plurivorum]|uniref:Uncharacterized protein n=1 Tax=Colletotrichum plurivorum TaxID=2175906 RepID=A0A8H6NPC9_9PEZI|nr:hypothetical protein CPLU01_01394 [Colletotrichum plurivorum]